MIVVAINANSTATSQSFSISGFSEAKATPYVTDTTRSLAAQTAVTVSGNAFTYCPSSKSVTNFVIDPTFSTGINVQASARHLLQVVRRADGFCKPQSLPNFKDVA